MNLTLSSRSKTRGFLGKLLYASLSVWMLGVVYAPAQAAVAIDQQPLIIQQPLPPNITLMLDDSGSMAWDFMPDLGYINNSYNPSAMIDSSNNGVYYNPAIAYIPPVKADGTSYPNASGLTSAWVDGFNTYRGSADLTTYNGWSDTGWVRYSASTGGGGKKLYKNVSSRYLCRTYYYSQTLGAYKYSYDHGDEECTIYYSGGSNFFQYSTGPAAGPYTVHYVADTNCGSQANCVLASDTSGVAAPSGVAAGQNVANWFSYYHTRILMAKSGLMDSFATISPTFRVGFGSINGRNNSALPSPTSVYNNKTIAAVQLFGDGTPGTQKAEFWNWLVGEFPSGGTPLRVALDAVGQYYQSSQPWQTSNTDHTEIACRQSNTILTTDGFWNGYLNNGPGNADNTPGPTNTDPNNVSSSYANVAPYADGYSNTLADVAMKYWKTDLRNSVPNEVPTNQDDKAFWQHMTTFTLGLGFPPTGIQPAGTSVKDIFDWANGVNGTGPIPGFSWPAPSSNSINNIADLVHAAVNGHGGFYSATSPQTFVSGLRDALKRATDRTGTGASLAANSTQLKSGTVAYQANYYTLKWTGDLKALQVDPTTGAIAAKATWSAAAALPAAASRNIYTYNPTALPNKQLVAFTAANLSGLSGAEQAALGTTANDQKSMIDYLRGDSSKEQKNTGGVYRNRDTPFGDVVNSQPVYVGAPDPNRFYTQSFTGSSTFGAYASSNASRAPLMLVAANDGMLHVLDAVAGTETYAYIPSAVITDGLSQLANPDYGTNVPHQFFNDGELTVADAYFASAWHTVAVGTTGRGTARAIYALDVTDPANIKFLWERSAGDGQLTSKFIGQMSGKPVIAQTADGVWSVLIGNGYNSTVGRAALLQFDLPTGSLDVHLTTDLTLNNGLAAPAAWLDDPSNGVSSVAYAGDLHGHVWSFTLNTGSGVLTSTPVSVGNLLFTAIDSGGKVQSITGGMLAGKDPLTSNVWVFFGTGQYLSSADLSNRDVQSWYGLIVQSTTASLVSNLSTGRAALNQRQILAETQGSAGSPTATPPVLPTSAARVVTPTPVPSDMTGKSGWYFDLVSPVNGKEGERMITPNQFQGNLLLGTTRIPQATDVCNPSGRGWIMAVNPFTGTNPSSNFFDLNGDGRINGSDTVTIGGKSYPAAGVGFSALPNNPIFVGSTMLVSFDNGSTGSFKTSGTSGGVNRVSWRELINQ
ncbi:MAG: pilus assembly protein PilY [Rhodanobacter sp.]|nr:MAG: pilus assembly protein PilY [Rhodanobacter sp.]